MVNPALILAIFDGLGGMEMLVIFVLALMLFGGKRLPEVAKGLGKSVREFRKAASGVEDEIRKAMDMDHKPARRPPVRRPRKTETPANPGETPLPEPRVPPSPDVPGDSGATDSIPEDTPPEEPKPPTQG